MPVSTDNHQENMILLANQWRVLVDRGDLGAADRLVEALSRKQGPTLLDAAFRSHGGANTGKIRSKHDRTTRILHRWMDGGDQDGQKILLALSRTVSSWDLRHLLDRLE